MAEVKRVLYRYVLRRTSTFCLAMACSAMFFERTYDQACEYVFEKLNEGRLWMHIKHKYEETPDEVHNLALTPKISLEEVSRGKSEAGKNLTEHETLEKKNEGKDREAK